MSETRCPASPSALAFSPTQAAVEPWLFGRLTLFGRGSRLRFGFGSFGPRRCALRAVAAAPPARPSSTTPVASAGFFAFSAKPVPPEFREDDELLLLDELLRLAALRVLFLAGVFFADVFRADDFARDFVARPPFELVLAARFFVCDFFFVLV